MYMFCVKIVYHIIRFPIQSDVWVPETHQSDVFSGACWNRFGKPQVSLVVEGQAAGSHRTLTAEESRRKKKLLNGKDG